MNHKSSRVNSMLVAIREHLTIFINMDHIRSGKQAKMDTKRVNPKGSRVNGVTDRNVASGTLGEAFTGKDTESSGHVVEHPAALGVRVCELGLLVRVWEAAKSDKVGSRGLSGLGRGRAG